MKSSVYRLSHGVYMADLAGQQIMRGSVEDLAAALVKIGVTIDNLLLGDWRQDAELLNSAEQRALHKAMAARQDSGGAATAT